MIIYIITKCGRVLKDEPIQYLLERISLAEKQTQCFYRCPSIYRDHQELIDELGRLRFEYRFLFYDNMDNWALLNDLQKGKFIEALKDPNNTNILLNEILSKQMISE